jgi:DNA mismatch endonuclease, patch repair protein
MRSVRREGTNPEQTVAAQLRKLGVHFRRNVKGLPGSPDFANQSQQWAVFVHGCFWHRHNGCTRTTTPTRNRKFWLDKFEANEKRDRKKTRLLRGMGFRVLTVWECEAKRQMRLLSRLKRFLGAM